jgi:hypothetical protein
LGKDMDYLKPKIKTTLLCSLILYLAWTLSTYLLEGRVNLLQAPTIAGRYLYVLAANVVIGTIIALWFLRSRLTSRIWTAEQAGFQSFRQTLITILIALVLGFIDLLLTRLNHLPWLVILNGYVQVLPTSIAEILVCWVLVGHSFESLLKPHKRWLALLVGIITATLFFSAYHLGHSAPFNQLPLMLILLMPGLVTSLFYLITREIYATILFHNFQGIIGVIGNLKNQELLNRPLYPLYFLMILSIIILIAADIGLIRRKRIVI